jgi:hypothetical protein
MVPQQQCYAKSRRTLCGVETAAKERPQNMGQVTILNGMNVPINSCISAVINLSWCNKLFPKTYYQHDGAASVVTLNVNYWFGEETEFSSDPGTVVTTVLGAVVAGVGVVIAVVGVVLLPVSAGTSSALIVGGSALAVQCGQRGRYGRIDGRE